MPTLLLADDSVTTQRVIALTFADESFRVVSVGDGQQAMAQMAQMRPDIVLAGTTLPQIDGYELAAYMRGVEGLKTVPVLLLSGAFESVDAARLKASGARGVIEKPLEPTAVISRVRELLGLKDARPAPPAGRLVTSAETTPDKRGPSRVAQPPARKAPAASWEELREESGLEPDARSVEGATSAAGRADYLDTLDDAFDSLDKHLAGRQADVPVSRRNPSPPLGQASGAPDPRSPGRRPAASEGGTPNSVFEVDAEWFPDDSRARERESRHDILADAHEAMPPRASETSGAAVFEVDDDWFADGNRVRESQTAQRRELAAEMGIHDIELPPAEPVPNAPAPAEGLDFDFGLDDLPAVAPAIPVAAPTPPPAVAGPPPVVPVVATPPIPVPYAAPAPVAPAPVAPAPVAPAPVAASPVDPAPTHIAPFAPVAPVAPLVFPEPVPAVTSVTGPDFAQGRASSVADDFAALLAFETGDAVPASAAEPEVAQAGAPVVVQAVAPQMTDSMLDQIAARVVERLSAGTFGADFRESMTVTVRDTVRSVVSETSERLVLDEIARVKARAERDTP